jgi:hypothetical protein
LFLLLTASSKTSHKKQNKNKKQIKIKIKKIVVYKADEMTTVTPCTVEGKRFSMSRVIMVEREAKRAVTTMAAVVTSAARRVATTVERAAKRAVTTMAAGITSAGRRAVPTTVARAARRAVTTVEDAAVTTARVGAVTKCVTKCVAAPPVAGARLVVASSNVTSCATHHRRIEHPTGN